MINDEPKPRGITFTPIIPITDLTSAQRATLLRDELPNMERGRGWWDRPNKPGVRSILQESNAQYIESILEQGGTITELGAGHLVATKELAKQYPGATLIAVEPFIDEHDVIDLPGNVRVIRKKGEEITHSDIPPQSVDGSFSAFALDYAPDKLAFLRANYDLLKPNARAIIHFIGNSINPHIQDIFASFQLNDVLQMSPRSNAGLVFSLQRQSEEVLDFGKYTFTTAPLDRANLSTTYMFE